ncbi:MAG: hypothetical protein ACYS9X_31390 [Planctomycetota bacterium]|jgi:hypothetical protein
MAGREALLGAALHTLAAGPRPRRVGAPALVAACVAFIAGLAGCGGIKPKRTPQGTFDSLRKAIAEENYEALWGLLSASARQSESARIRAKQLRVEAELPNYAEADKESFRDRNGISAEEFVNLSPAGVFAMELRYSRRLGTSLRELLEGSKAKGVSVKGESAVVEVEISGEAEPVKLALEKQSGLWRMPGMEGFLEAFDIAGRARRAGEIPADTHRAAVACIGDEAYDDLWELFSTDARAWLAGIIKGDQKEVAAYDEEKARMFERAAGLATKDFAAMSPKDAFVVEMKSGVGRLMQLARLLAGEFVKADILGDKATITLRGLRGALPLERENGRWYFARME